MESRSNYFFLDHPYIGLISSIASPNFSKGYGFLFYDVTYMISGAGNIIRWERCIPRNPEEIIHLSYLRNRLVDSVSKNIREKLDLDSWVKLNEVINLPLVPGFSYMDLDDFLKVAIIETVNSLIRDLNKKEQELYQKLMQSRKDEQPYRSPMEGVPKPNFR